MVIQPRRYVHIKDGKNDTYCQEPIGGVEVEGPDKDAPASIGGFEGL